jgi:hypothetical protein
MVQFLTSPGALQLDEVEDPWDVVREFEDEDFDTFETVGVLSAGSIHKTIGCTAELDSSSWKSSRDWLAPYLLLML